MPKVPKQGKAKSVNQFAGSQPSHLPQKLCNQKDTHSKYVNNPPYKGRGPTAN